MAASPQYPGLETFLSPSPDKKEELWMQFILPGRLYVKPQELEPRKRKIDQDSHFERHDGIVYTQESFPLEYNFFKIESASSKPPPLHSHCMIFLHTHGGNRLEGLPLLRPCGELTMNFCCFDFAGSGNSGGIYSTIGVKEANDIQVVMEELRKKFNIQKFVLWGRSMGAVAALIHAYNRKEDIEYLVLDSPYPSIEQIVRDTGSKFMKIGEYVALMMFNMTKNVMLEKTGVDFSETNPIECCPAMEIPCLFVVGNKDELVLPERVEKMFLEYKSPMRSFEVVQGTHSSPRSNTDIQRLMKYLRDFYKVDRLKAMNKSIFSAKSFGSSTSLTKKPLSKFNNTISRNNLSIFTETPQTEKFNSNHSANFNIPPTQIHHINKITNQTGPSDHSNTSVYLREPFSKNRSEHHQTNAHLLKSQEWTREDTYKVGPNGSINKISSIKSNQPEIVNSHIGYQQGSEHLNPIQQLRNNKYSQNYTGESPSIGQTKKFLTESPTESPSKLTNKIPFSFVPQSLHKNYMGNTFQISDLNEREFQKPRNSSDFSALKNLSFAEKSNPGNGLMKSMQKSTAKLPIFDDSPNIFSDPFQSRTSRISDHKSNKALNGEMARKLQTHQGALKSMKNIHEQDDPFVNDLSHVPISNHSQQNEIDPFSNPRKTAPGKFEIKNIKSLTKEDYFNSQGGQEPIYSPQIQLSNNSLQNSSHQHQPQQTTLRAVTSPQSTWNSPSSRGFAVPPSQSFSGYLSRPVFQAPTQPGPLPHQIGSPSARLISGPFLEPLQTQPPIQPTRQGQTLHPSPSFYQYDNFNRRF